MRFLPQVPKTCACYQFRHETIKYFKLALNRVLIILDKILSNCMIIVSDLELFKSRDYVTLQCEHCSTHFSKMKKNVLDVINGYKTGLNFCSSKCESYHGGYLKDCVCHECNKTFTRVTKEIKSENIFCSQHCFGKYNSRNKTHGYRRSKLETWIESHLKEKYKYYKILFNDRKTAGLELDIYFPDLKIAFEINGIFHYKPIYGDEQFDKIKINDESKRKYCLTNNIELYVIDISYQKQFKPDKSLIHLNFIYDILDKKITNNPTLGLYDTVQNIIIPPESKPTKEPKIKWPPNDEIRKRLEFDNMRNYAKELNTNRCTLSNYCRSQGIFVSKKKQK